MDQETPIEQSPPKLQIENLGTSPNLFKLDESHHPMVSTLARAGEWFVRLLKGKERSPARLAISGSPGTGKTHTAHIIKRYAESYGADIIFRKGLGHWSCLWIDWVRIAETEDEWRYEDLLYQIRECSLLVLDDVGSETDRFKSGVSGSRLRRVLSEIERKWVVLTCNPSQEKLCELYDVRVVDRLRTFQWMELGSIPSYRPKLKP